MSAGWETTINTGNPQQDQATIQAWQQQVAAQGLSLQVTPMPQGGFHVRAVPMNAGPAAPVPMGAPQTNQYGMSQPSQPSQPSQGAYGGAFGGQPSQPQAGGYGAPAASGGVFAAAGAAMGGAAPQSQPWNAGAAAGISPAQGMGLERIQYLRKVYGLLAGSALAAFAVGGLVTSSAFGTEQVPTNVGTLEVPTIVFTMLQNPVLMLAAFGVLFVSTFIASWVSKVKVVNVVALFGVAALMGLQLAPMVWIAMIKGELGMAASASPVRDAGIMTLSVFAGITGYVFVTKKDFSYMRGFLSMASMALFAACLLTFVFQSEVFSLAVAGVGALITIAMLLYVTSFIFRNSEMDDPVGDALALLVQLRNLFMFLLRLFMSSRD